MAKQDLGLTRRMAEYAAATSYEQLPGQVRQMAKLCILDALASMIVGRPLRAGELAARYARETISKPEATVVGTRLRASAEIAAFANGTSAHADEIDDVGETHNHPGAAVISAVLATAEKRNANGQDVINAVVLGYDICARVIRAIGPQRVLMSVKHAAGDSFLGLGATAAVGRLLGLSVEQHRHAFALAAMYVGTTIAFMDERWHITKGMNLGKSAHTGVFAATLAALGFEGNDDVFEGRHGVLETWAADEPADALIRNLGTDFEVLKTHFKFYSAGHPIHSPVHLVLKLMREHQLHASEIRELHLHVTTYAAGIVADRDTPSICLQDMVAVAAVKGKLGVVEAHDESNFTLPLVRQVRERITVHRDPQMDVRDPASFGALVRLQTDDGRMLEAQQEFPPGDYRETPPADWARIQAKFRDVCAQLLSPDAIDSGIEQVCTLEKADSLAPLMAALSRTDK